MRASNPVMMGPTWIPVMVSGWLALGAGLPALGQVRVISSDQPISAFAGRVHQLPLTIENGSGRPFEAGIRYRVFQATAALAAPLGEDKEWKRLSILPGQKIVESFTLQLPVVRAKTAFLVKWSDDGGRPLGTTQVAAYPTNLLEELAPFAQREPIGLFDPQRQLEPLLVALRFEVYSLDGNRFAGFRGRLAILLPPTNSEPRADTTQQARALAKEGTGVVLLVKPGLKDRCPLPLVYPVSVGRGTVVVADPDLMGNLRDDPETQLRLIGLARLAVEGPNIPLPGERED